MARYFLFYRFWTGYTASFPIGLFDHTSDTDIDAERDKLAKEWAASHGDELGAFRVSLHEKQAREAKLRRLAAASRMGSSAVRPRPHPKKSMTTQAEGPTLTEEVELAREWRYPSRTSGPRFIPAAGATKLRTDPHRVYIGVADLPDENGAQRVLAVLNERFCAPIANARAQVFKMQGVLRLGFDAAASLPPERVLAIELGIDDWKKNTVAYLVSLPVAAVLDDMHRAIALLSASVDDPGTGRATEAARAREAMRRRGRPKEPTTVSEDRIGAAWAAGQFTTYANCARELGCTAEEVERVVGRLRKRGERA